MLFRPLVFSALLLSSASLSAIALTQTPPVQDEATVLDDVIVEGRSTRSVTDSFVGNISAPALQRGPARWDRQVCIGVTNLRAEVAQPIIDRISDVATQVGLSLAPPGCKPNLVIMMTDDGQAMARQMVQSRGRDMMVTVSGATLGRKALEAFQTTDRAVRWWHISLPIAPSGAPTVRLPGQGAFNVGGSITRPSDLGDFGVQNNGSRLTSPVKDELKQVVVIVDITKLEGYDFSQLADYLAMVGLAQIDPEARTDRFDTILNLFAPDGPALTGLTAFDHAYLKGLYSAQNVSQSNQARLSEVADGMARSLLD